MRAGVLTGGGDCPGLNAVIRAVVRKGEVGHGDSFVGFRDGGRGLTENLSRPLNEKIEGFFAVCREHGLTGDRGVIIPAANLRHLMVDHEVVDAVREGRFHVWAVDTIDDAIELLTGTDAR